MHPNEYQKNASRTECNYEKALLRMCPPLYECHKEEDRTKAIRINHAVIGLIGELGEIASVLQKWIYYGKPFSVEELKLKFTDEGGDCQWYLAQLFTAIGMPMDDALIANIRKLQARYPDKFTETLADDDNRDRVAEGKAVESVIEIYDQNGICIYCQGMGKIFYPKGGPGGVDCYRLCLKCNGNGHKIRLLNTHKNEPTIDLSQEGTGPVS